MPTSATIINLQYALTCVGVVSVHDKHETAIHLIASSDGAPAVMMRTCQAEPHICGIGRKREEHVAFGELI